MRGNNGVFCFAALLSYSPLNRCIGCPVHFILHLPSVKMFIVQVDAQANQQARLEAHVARKLQKKGLSSLTPKDVNVIMKQVYRVQAVLALGYV